MNIGFDNLHEHIILMDDFVLKWRFTDEKYDKLPHDHLSQLKPLDRKAAIFLWSYISDNSLHEHIFLLREIILISSTRQKYGRIISLK